MSRVDTAWLRMCRPTNPMMITGVLMFDEPMTLERLKQVIKKRFLAYPRFLQKAVDTPAGASWVDDADFDLDWHVRLTALPGRADPRSEKKSLERFVSRRQPSDNNNISPRLSVAYDLNGDGSAVVRAGAGYFFGRVPLVLGGDHTIALPLLVTALAGSAVDMLSTRKPLRFDLLAFEPSRHRYIARFDRPLIRRQPTNNTDAAASFSNFGPCVDWYAPGLAITSATYTDNYATAVKSGTSMASPHVAGTVALMLQKNPGLSQVAADTALTSSALDMGTGCRNVIPAPGAAVAPICWETGAIL